MVCIFEFTSVRQLLPVTCSCHRSRCLKCSREMEPWLARWEGLQVASVMPHLAEGCV